MSKTSGEPSVSSPVSDDAAGPFALGTVLDGRFVIGARLGRQTDETGQATFAGAIGVVYQASDRKHHNQPCVVKTLRDESLNNAKGLELFGKEREALVLLAGHEGVPRLIDSGQHNGRPFIVIEYVAGEMLSQVLEAGPLSLPRVAHLVRQLALTLDYAHNLPKSLCHRDLKPDNIIVSQRAGEPERVKVLDWGAVKVRASAVAKSGFYATRHIGTPYYAAPEQEEVIPSAEFDHRADIFALGVISYEMVTGERPFNAWDEAELQEFKKQAVFTLPRELRPDLPLAAEEAIAKALKPSPKERFGSAREFGETLATALTEKPVKRFSEWRKWWLVLGLLLALLTGGVGWWQWRNSAPTPSPEETQPARELLAYSLALQPLRNDVPAGPEFTTGRSEKLAAGWNYKLSLSRRADGFYYLLAERGAAEVKVLVAADTATATTQSGWQVYHRGERLWLVWAQARVPALEQRGPAHEIRTWVRAQPVATVDAGPALAVLSGTGAAVVYALPIAP